MNPEPRGGIAEAIGSSSDATSSTGDDPRVAAGLDEYLAELQAGRRPARAEFLNRHPEIADALDRGLDVLEFLHSAAGAGASQDRGPAAVDAPLPETVLGDYCLIREVGRGGMGVVYEARQISLGRRVAVKVLSAAGVLDPRRLQRFRIEAQAVAQLNHAHIVPIFAVGEDRDIHYYAMQYVEGCTLAEVLENHPARNRDRFEAPTRELGSRGPDPSSPESATPVYHEGSPSGLEESSFRLTRSAAGANITPIPSRDAFRAIAQLGIQAAEGLDHAHTMGILHRDIKPSNLLIDARGNLWITDFGLARFQDDSGLTATGDLVGTLRYMAPEMAMGRRMSFDPRSDIYALGATLYELLTLRPVFTGKDRRELLRQITQDEPVSSRRIDRAIPRDLETIVMKSMSKEPERRYPTAKDLADDLRRFLDDQPIQARPPSAAERLAKSIRRHRAVLTAGVIVATVTTGTAAALLWQEYQRTAEADKAKLLALGQMNRAFNSGDQAFTTGIESMPKGQGANWANPSGMFTLQDNLTMRGMERMAQTLPGLDPKIVDYYQKAIAFYEQVTREPASDPRMQALAFCRLGFTRMVATGGQDPRAMEDCRRAIGLYEKLMADHPRDRELREGLAQAHYYVGMLLVNRPDGMSQAEPSFRKMMAIDEERVIESPMESRLVQTVAGRRLGFIKYLELAGRKDDATRERGSMFPLYQRITDSAKTRRSKGPSLEEWACDCYRDLGGAFAVHEWTREQERALRRGLEFNPSHPDLLYDLANLLAFRTGAQPGELREAVELAKKAAGTAPQESENWRALALAQLRTKDLPSATEAVEKCLKLKAANGHAPDRLLMAMIRYEQGRKDEALGWYLQALNGQVDHPMDDPDLPRYLAQARAVLKPLLPAEPRAGGAGTASRGGPPPVGPPA